ncbi:hypothetical protein [Sanguibacteroides justesenii]|nr:hypothetical protein [Sanguibacteroides justesenii]
MLLITSTHPRENHETYTFSLSLKMTAAAFIMIGKTTVSLPDYYTVQETNGDFPTPPFTYNRFYFRLQTPETSIIARDTLRLSKTFRVTNT